MPLRTRDRNRVGEVPLGLGSGLEGLADGAQRGGVGDVGRVGLVQLESHGELVGLIEELGNSARHRDQII
jgi:hypothetical protein